MLGNYLQKTTTADVIFQMHFVLGTLRVNAGQKYCRMQEHSAILLTFIKLPVVIKTFVLSISECF